jgi:hypothetical protein
MDPITTHPGGLITKLSKQTRTESKIFIFEIFDYLRIVHARVKKFTRALGCLSWSLVWSSDPARPAGSSPAPWAGLGLAKKKNSIMWFFQNILLYFDQYWFVFLYCKDTNPVLKYQVFVKIKKIFFFVFMHTAKSLKNIYKKFILYFHITKKISKMCISMYFDFNNQFIKVTRTKPIFQKFQKNYFVFF